ncbi:DUF1700 domain-containing protein [Paenibacillus alvei]
MNKDQFIKELSVLLKDLNGKEKQEILHDYEEHFQFGIEEGKAENEIAASLGSPKLLAKEILANYHLENAKGAQTAGNVMRAVWAVIGLSFFNIIIVLGPFIALVGVILAGWAVSIAGISTPLLVLLNNLFGSSFDLFEWFLSFVYCGAGLLLFVGMQWITKWFMRGFVRYISFNTALVKGGIK